MRQPVDGLSVGGDPRFQRFVKAARVLRVDRGRVLLNRGQLPIKSLACQKVFKFRRLGSEILAHIGLTAQEGPRGLQRIARTIKVPQARLRQGLCQARSRV